MAAARPVDGAQDSPPAIARARWDCAPLQLVLCLLLALATRGFALGDPVYHIDENWYLFVGERLNAGDRLYVDLWDRKPPGLFLIYRLAAAFPAPVIAYQLAALVAAGGTAFAILRMARSVATPAAGLVAAALYLALLAQLGGAGGQSPVFYNALMAGAAWSVGFAPPEQRTGRREAFAMLLAGIAIAIKPTAGFEAVFLGLFLVWRLHEEGMLLPSLLRRAAVLACVGLAPALCVGAWFAAAGGFDTFWHAVVTSNFTKEGQMADPLRWSRVGLALLVLSFPLGAAVLAFATGRTAPFAARRTFLGGWILAAALGVLAVPNFYEHYLLPLLVPLCVAAAVFFARAPALLLLGGVGAMVPLLEGQPWDRDQTRRHIAQYDVLARAVREGGGARGMVVFDGPPSLYAAAGARPPSPIAFPNHWWDRAERDVSGRATAAEMARVLAQRPAVVVMGRETSRAATNFAVRDQLVDYTARCRLAASANLAGWTPTDRLDVFVDCDGG